MSRARREGGGGDERDGSDERDALIERVASAHRRRDSLGRIHDHPGWHDLDEPGRLEAFERALELRRMEAALDSEGLSTTARAVLAMITGR